jgi:hypothetical protein
MSGQSSDSANGAASNLSVQLPDGQVRSEARETVRSGKDCAEVPSSRRSKRAGAKLCYGVRQAGSGAPRDRRINELLGKCEGQDSRLRRGSWKHRQRGGTRELPGGHTKWPL